MTAAEHNSKVVALVKTLRDEVEALNSDNQRLENTTEEKCSAKDSGGNQVRRLSWTYSEETDSIELEPIDMDNYTTVYWHHPEPKIISDASEGDLYDREIMTQLVSVPPPKHSPTIGPNHQLRRVSDTLSAFIMQFFPG